jgi:hypothetical protein
MIPGSALAWTEKQAAWLDCWRGSRRAERASENDRAWDDMIWALPIDGTTNSGDPILA